jgi:hypothetical protein
MRENISRNATALITNPDNDMLWCLTYRDLDWRWRRPSCRGPRRLLVLHAGLDAIPQQLADYIF